LAEELSEEKIKIWKVNGRQTTYDRRRTTDDIRQTTDDRRRKTDDVRQMMEKAHIAFGKVS
jgi:transcriptional regulator NrdR family protein